MECPSCKKRINNEDKLSMCEHGEWRITNPKADPTYEGFELPTWYAPVGWTSWKDMAQEYVTACTCTDGTEDEKLTAFYNTLLGQRYVKGANSQNWRVFFEKGQMSTLKRGNIPTWVNFITTGADVQGNRIEVSVRGWGRLGHSLAIDHFEIPVGENELEVTNSEAWEMYKEATLNMVFERDDGLKMQTIANAIDSSYKSDCLYAFYMSLPKDQRERLILVKGRDNMTGYMPNKKIVKAANLTGCVWYEVPVSSLKHAVFSHLDESIKDYTGEAPAYYMEFPMDYNQEYYQQLFSEVWMKDGKKWVWKKTRDRNEILDCTVYNLALFYHLGLSSLTAESWEEIAKSQEAQASGGLVMRRQAPRRRRMMSRGVEI